MSFVTPERHRLTTAVRHLIDAVVSLDDATEEQLGTAADMAESAARHLGRTPSAQPFPDPTRTLGQERHVQYLPRSPVVGDVSPLAPPIAWELVDGRIEASGRFGWGYQGPPGYVHGGVVALTFDEMLGMANIASGHPGMTGTLKVRYLKPTPLHRDVEVDGWTERVEGRRIVARGSMRVDGEVTAEAEGLFVAVDPALAARYFPEESAEAAPSGVEDDDA
jgi:acyl-coenzyme A thioesterase PaaI-like protein